MACLIFSLFFDISTINSKGGSLSFFCWSVNPSIKKENNGKHTSLTCGGDTLFRFRGWSLKKITWIMAHNFFVGSANKGVEASYHSLFVSWALTGAETSM